SAPGVSTQVGVEDQSCTTRLSRKNRNCAPPPTQPPGLVVPAADTTSFSPATTRPSACSSVTDSVTLNPLSPWVASHALPGQAPAGGVLVSARGTAWLCSAPVIAMLSRYQPSSPMVPAQEPISSYDWSQQSNSQDCAIQRTRTLCPR